MTSPLQSKASSLHELAILFLKLGSTSFGGPAAHVAMFEEEVVRRRCWLSSQEFLDLLSATQLIPGPNSTEMAIHIGHRRAGWPGLFVAGVSFILPAMLIVTLIAWTYVRYGTLPEVGALLYGIKPVIIAIIIHALLNLSKAALKTSKLITIGIIALVAHVAGLNEIFTLLLAGMISLFMSGSFPAFPSQVAVLGAGSGVFFSLKSGLAAVATAATAFSLNHLFFIFLKVGSVLFGSGYVLLAFLRSDLVEHYQWLSEAQLLDATAVGQFTPGPVFTTATFIGYVLSGPKGALVATVGIFLPAFFFVALSAPFVPKLRESVRFGHFLDGVNAGSLALLAAVSWYLARAAIIDLWSVGIAVAAFLLLFRARINSAYLVILGGVTGIILSQFPH